MILSKQTLNDFLLKSGVRLSYIAKETGINRTELSFHLHAHRDLTPVKQQKVINFMEEYIKRWK
jgi:hypothetical protein